MSHLDCLFGSNDFFKSNPLKMMSFSLLSIVSIALAATVSATSDGTNAYTATKCC